MQRADIVQRVCSRPLRVLVLVSLCIVPRANRGGRQEEPSKTIKHLGCTPFAAHEDRQETTGASGA